MIEFFIDDSGENFVLRLQNNQEIKLTKEEAKYFKGKNKDILKVLNSFLSSNNELIKQTDLVYYKDQAIKCFAKGNTDRARYYAEKFKNCLGKEFFNDQEKKLNDENLAWYSHFKDLIEQSKKNVA